ncbi:MAG TPA: sugar ABC transporter ATP-binding protein [Solirubrobacterales bacterium]|jgi:ABC-type sugar transport system ATPase subunit|nr:sugar ABC transporter ATP-binding protein [Solirubrobacterales bacterium]
MAAGEQVIEVHDVWKRYGGTPVLREVSTALAGGEVLGLIGANGAGKSTLMRILTGAEHQDEGSVTVLGHDGFATPRQAREAGVARVAQEIQLVQDQSVADNLLLGRFPSRFGVLQRRRLLDRAAATLEEVGLAVDPRREVERLTPVEQRLLTIAQALVVRPQVLVLDEPTAALPPEIGLRLRPIIERLAAGGTAVIYVSHHLSEVRDICSRVLAMRDGHVAGVLERDEIDVEKMVVLVGGSALAEEPTARRRRPGGKPVLRTKELCGVKVRDLDMELHRGEIVGVGGLHGAGRSELLRLLAGVQKPSSGEIERLEPGRATLGRASRQVGYVTERRREMLFGEMSTIANASIANLPSLSWGGVFIRRGVETRQVKEMTTEISFRGKAEAPVSTLSGGNAQKVCLARWLVKGCDLLILDEPTIGVDVHARAEIHRLLRGLTESGMTIVVASADPEELVLLCDRVLVLVEGHLAAELDSPVESETLVRRSYATESQPAG